MPPGDGGGGAVEDEEAVEGREIGVLVVVVVIAPLAPFDGLVPVLVLVLVLVLVSSSITRQISSRHAAATTGSNARLRII